MRRLRCLGCDGLIGCAVSRGIWMGMIWFDLYEPDGDCVVKGDLFLFVVVVDADGAGVVNCVGCSWRVVLGWRSGHDSSVGRFFEAD